MEEKKTNYRWIICVMLFFATTINYMDRQLLSLTWKDFIAPEFHWSDVSYGKITAWFTAVYAIANLFSGRFIDWIGTRKGYVITIAVWSLGACLHALCGLATMGWLDIGSHAEMYAATGTLATSIASVSICFFIVARIVLAIGESGNFPAAIKVTAEYFPMRDRAYATSLFNAGATVGAMVSPFTIPLLARYFKNIGWGNGWEMAFIIIGALGFVWLGVWLFVYKRPAENKRVNAAELAYINMDKETESQGKEKEDEETVPFLKLFRFSQTWAIFFARMFTDGVWWFFLFWTPAYLSDVYGLKSHNPTAMLLITVLYTITLLSIYGGKLPTIIMNRTGLIPYEARLRALFIFALVPLLVTLAQPLGNYSYWFPVIIIGLGAAAHQSWSANMYSVVSDLYPKGNIGTLTGFAGVAAGIGSSTISIISGYLFDYADKTNMQLLGFEGKPAGYFIVFCYCAVAYLLGWCILKAVVPHYKPVRNQ